MGRHRNTASFSQSIKNQLLILQGVGNIAGRTCRRGRCPAAPSGLAAASARSHSFLQESFSVNQKRQREG